MIDCVSVPYSPLSYPSLIYFTSSIPLPLSLTHALASPLFVHHLPTHLSGSLSLSLSSFSSLNPTLSPWLQSYLHFLPAVLSLYLFTWKWWELLLWQSPNLYIYLIWPMMPSSSLCFSLILNSVATQFTIHPTKPSQSVNLSIFPIEVT